MNSSKKIAMILLVIMAFSALGASEMVVNSQDWRDNSLMISYSHFTGEDVRMVTSLGEGQLISKALGRNSTHTVYSSDNPVWDEFDEYLRNNDLDVESESVNWSQDQYELYSQVSDEVEGFVVVKPDYGFNTISVFPKVVNDDYWLLYYEGDETVEFLQQHHKTVTFYGRYLDQPWLSLGERDTEYVSTGSMSGNNKEIVRDQFRRQGSESVVVAGDSYIEKGFLKKGRPILLSQGLQSTVEIIEQYNTSIVEVIGAENVNFGNSIKDRLGDQVSVIAKFGRKFTGLEGLQDTYPIKKFPVERVNRNVSLEEVSVDLNETGTDTLRMIYSNSGNIPTEVDFSAAELVYSGSPNQLVSEQRQIMVRPGASTALTLEANISSEPSEASVSFDYQGKSGLNTQDYEVVSDEPGSADVVLQDLYYSRPDQVIVAEVKSNSDESVWVDAELNNLTMFNRSMDVLADERTRLGSGETGRLTYDVRLTESQVQGNSEFDVSVYAGSGSPRTEKTFTDVELRVTDESITGSFISGATPVIAGVLILVVLLAVVVEYRTSGFSEAFSGIRG